MYTFSLLLLVTIATQLVVINSYCCSSGLSCKNHGDCNVFCCNCDGGCRTGLDPYVSVWNEKNWRGHGRQIEKLDKCVNIKDQQSCLYDDHKKCLKMAFPDSIQTYGKCVQVIEYQIEYVSY